GLNEGAGKVPVVADQLVPKFKNVHQALCLPCLVISAPAGRILLALSDSDYSLAVYQSFPRRRVEKPSVQLELQLRNQVVINCSFVGRAVHPFIAAND
ncbi:MAG: hypothetical protein SVU24_05295, partial [Pseudomonadota bacterium]|nr:hypothetical protein [Pseudomonadota bacterium]